MTLSQLVLWASYTARQTHRPRIRAIMREAKKIAHGKK